MSEANTESIFNVTELQQIGSENLSSLLYDGSAAALLLDMSASGPDLIFNMSLDNLTTWSATDMGISVLPGNESTLGEDVDMSWSYCNEWTIAQHNLYQTANLIMAASFLVPATFKQSVLLVRALLFVSYVLLSCWTALELCAPDMMAWNMLMALINLVHTVSLIVRFVPPTLNAELTELYMKVFQPLRVSKKHFKELVKESHMATLDKGDIYAVEEASPADERLSILLSGRLRVTCDDTHLHFISAYQFIDSPEWEANHEQSDDTFQVTITAEEDTRYLCWPRMRLERVLRHRPLLKVVMDSVIGKDITQKLYSLNDHLCHMSGLDKDRARVKRNEIWARATRSMSMDAVYTGPTGLVRSASYRQAVSGQQRSLNVSNTSLAEVQPNRLHKQWWIPIVAKQFPAEYPFAGIVFQRPLQPTNNNLMPPLVVGPVSPTVNQEFFESPTQPVILQIPVLDTAAMTRSKSFIKRNREVKFEM